MIVLAAICAAGCVWLAAETFAGRPPSWPRRSQPRRHRQTVSRQVWLSQAGATVTPTQFWAVSAALAAVVYLLLFALDRTVIVAALPALGVGAVPYAYWSAQRRRRAAARLEAWPDALRHVSGALKAGIATLHEALVELSVVGPEPLRAPMARYVRLADRVGSLAALEAVRAELADPVSDSVLLTFETASAEGTTMVLKVLDGLLSQISGDLALAEKIRTLQTQSRLAAWASLVIPYLLLVFLCATTVSFRHFYDSALGILIVVVGGLASAGGFAITRRLARPIATTERIFVQPAAGRTGAAVAGQGRERR